MTSLTEMIDEISKTTNDRQEVSLGIVLKAVGRRSFSPILLLAGLIILAPIIGDIPGMPTIMGVLVFLTAVQMLFGREYFWLPDWLLKRSVQSGHLQKALDWLRKPSAFVDQKLTRKRLTFLTNQTGTRVVALICLIITVAIPAMELIPFSANGAGITFTTLGLSLVAHDGLWTLAAIIVAIGTIAFILMNLL